jgi:ABC-2 type transport system permease protein
MNTLLHIGWYKLVAGVARSVELKPSNFVKQLASLCVFGAFAYASFLAARAGVTYLLGSAHLGLFLLHRFLSMALFVFFLSVHVGNIVVSYATFYRSHEVGYYLTTPVSHGSLFVMKFIDNFFSSSAAFLLIAVALCAGYGACFDVSIWFYVGIVVLMLIPLMLIAGALAVLLLVAVISAVRPIGVRKTIVFMILAYLGVLYGYFRATNPTALVNGVLAHFPDVDAYYGSLDPWFSRYLPSHWIADALYWIASGKPGQAVQPMALLLGLTAIVVTAMLLVGRRLFYRSWLIAQELQQDRPVTSRTTRLSIAGRWQSSPQMTVLLKKEFWQFVREPSQWIHFSVIVVLLLTFLVSIAGIDFRKSIPFLQSVSYSVLFVFNAFLVASIALRFVYPALSLEGENIWSIMAAPVKRGTVFRMKFFLGLVPILLLSQWLVIMTNRSIGNFPELDWAIALAMLGLAYALVGLNFGAGVFFADFHESNPLRITSTQGATLTFLISVGIITLALALLFFPINNAFEHVLRSAPLFPGLLIRSSLAVVLISAIIGTFSLWVGSRALRRDI